MKRDLYTDQILGSWKFDKKNKDKSNIQFYREAKVSVHPDYSVSWIDPEDYKEYKVHGEVILTERKFVSLETSEISLHRGIKVTDGSIKNLKL